MKRQYGLAPVLVIIIFGLVVITGVVGYLLLNPSAKVNLPSYTPDSQVTPVISVTPEPVSDSEDIKTLQMEFEQTTSGSIESDLDSLDQEASGL